MAAVAVAMKYTTIASTQYGVRSRRSLCATNWSQIGFLTGRRTFGQPGAELDDAGQGTRLPSRIPVPVNELGFRALVLPARSRCDVPRGQFAWA